MTDDGAFERDLRAMLAARDPGPAPTVLATVVRSRLRNDRRPRRLASAGRWAGAAVVLGAVAAVLILAIVVARPSSVSPGSTPLPTQSPYTIGAGDGVVRGESYPIVQIALALITATFLVRGYARATVRRNRIAFGLGIAIMALAAMKIGTPDAVAFGAIGEEALDPGGHDPSGAARFVVDVVGDSPFTLILTVSNTSRLPLDIEGIAEPASILPGEIPQARFVGVGVIADPSANLTAQPRFAFAPRTLWPGESVDLALLGMAGQCAISPSTAAGGFISLEDVEIVYEQLTLRHTATVVLPEPVNVSEPDHCP